MIGLPKRPVELVESAGLEKMLAVSTLAGVEKIEDDDASVFTVEKMDGEDEASADDFEEGEKTLEAGVENRFPAGLKGEDAEEPKREELAAAPPNTEPPTGFEEPPNIELLLELELGVKERAALGVVASFESPGLREIELLLTF